MVEATCTKFQFSRPPSGLQGLETDKMIILERGVGMR